MMMRMMVMVMPMMMEAAESLAQGFSCWLDLGLADLNV